MEETIKTKPRGDASENGLDLILQRMSLRWLLHISATYLYKVKGEVKAVQKLVVFVYFTTGEQEYYKLRN